VSFPSLDVCIVQDLSGSIRQTGCRIAGQQLDEYRDNGPVVRCGYTHSTRTVHRTL